MTKYEPQSCSRILMAVKKIGLVSNSGLLCSLGYMELMVTKPIKANEMFSRMSGM